MTLFLAMLIIPAGEASRSTGEVATTNEASSKKDVPELTPPAPRAGAKTEAPPAPAKDEPGGENLSAGLTAVLNGQAPLSAAVITALHNPSTAESAVSLLASWDGREDFTADRAGKVDETASPNTQVRVGISEHTFANGFAENVFYYGDTVGNLTIGTDTNPGAGSQGALVNTTLAINIPQLVNTGTSGGVTLLNPFSSDCMDTQASVTGIAVNPVADLADFGAAFCGITGEIVYVSVQDNGGCATNAAGQPFRTRIFAFGFTDNAGGVTPVGANQLLRTPFSNAGIAVDDDGSLYFALIDRITNTGGAIFKATELQRITTGARSLRAATAPSSTYLLPSPSTARRVR